MSEVFCFGEDGRMYVHDVEVQLPRRRTRWERKAYLAGFNAGVMYALTLVEDPAITPLDAAEIRAEAERFLVALDAAARENP